MTELEEKLQRLNVTKINSIDDLKKVMDFDEDHEPNVVADGYSLIIMDNQKYNETYLIDTFEEFMNEEKEQEVADFFNKTKFYYVDSPEIKSYIMRMGEIAPIQNVEYLEKNELVPSLFILNKDKNDIGIRRESKISILYKSDFKDLYDYITRK
jgi:hypothetical protein